INYYTYPFPHLTVSSFLPPNAHDALCKSFSNLTFTQKKTDLFSLYQTNALSVPLLDTHIRDTTCKHSILNNPEYDNNKVNENANDDVNNDSMENEFSNKEDDNITINDLINVNTRIDTFASYYTCGDYLLPHDDSVDTRRLAFCYYLEDFSSGELVLYDGSCENEVKRIPVKGNLLVVFGVKQAYHE
ncbi:Prolyl 3-hydroxylase ogfod1, partial [Conglomerata obtusa]